MIVEEEIWEIKDKLVHLEHLAHDGVDGSEKTDNPIKAAKIKNHFFVLMFSFNINALASIPKGIAN